MIARTESDNGQKIRGEKLLEGGKTGGRKATQRDREKQHKKHNELFGASCKKREERARREWAESRERSTVWPDYLSSQV